MKKNIIREYTIIDVNAPNKNNDAVCSIAILHIKNNEIIEEKSYLVNPECYFDDASIKKHGVTPDMVYCALTFDKVWKNIKNYFTNGIIISHNAVNNLKIISKTLIRYSIPVPHFFYVCTMNMAKDNYSNLKRYSLDYLCDEFGISYEENNNGLFDAFACYNLFRLLNNGYSVFDKDIKGFTYDKVTSKLDQITTSTELNKLYGIILGITSNKKINKGQIELIENWLNNNKQYSRFKPFNVLVKKLDHILEDGRISYEEQDDLLNLSLYYMDSKSFDEATFAIQILLGIVETIGCDKKIDKSEIDTLHKWLALNNQLNGNYLYDRIFKVVNRVLADNIVTERENKELVSLFENLVKISNNNK